LAALATALVLAARARGTTLSEATTAEMVVEADRVCAATVESVEPRRDPRSGFVFSHVRLRLLEEMKSDAGDAVLELRLPGGAVDGVRTVAPGFPRFEKGDEALFLLGPRNAEGYPVVLHASRGVIPLRADKARRRCLCAPVTGLSELSGERQVTLDAFRASVQRLLKARAAEKPR
jgi:hypothetical protein